MLTEIARVVDQRRVKANQERIPTEKTLISFCKEGQINYSASKKTISHPSILSRAVDWKLQVDVMQKLIFPQEIAVTTLRPDLILTSQSSKSIIIVELTVPWEERIDVSHELKFAKYQGLVEEAQTKGWQALQFPIEVGCRGFPATSLRYLLKQLGLATALIRKEMKAIGAVAESSSRWLWLRRNDKWTISASEG